MVDYFTKINQCKFCHAGEKLVLATNLGFKIYEVSPVFKLLHDKYIEGGVALIEFLDISEKLKTNLHVILVGTG